MRKFGSHLETIQRSIVVISCITFLGCTALRPIPISSNVPKVEVGDVVQIVRKNGEVREIEVTNLQQSELVGISVNDGVRGEQVSIDYDDISTIHRRELSTVKTIALVVITIAGIYWIGSALGGPTWP